MDETFQTGKGLAGLDEHQVRRYPSWSRWGTLAMLAHAFLAVVRADEHARRPGDLAHRLGWSDWRRRHQARSRTSRYLRQAASQT